MNHGREGRASESRPAFLIFYLCICVADCRGARKPTPNEKAPVSKSRRAPLFRGSFFLEEEK